MTVLLLGPNESGSKCVPILHMIANYYSGIAFKTVSVLIVEDKVFIGQGVQAIIQCMRVGLPYTTIQGDMS